MKFAYILSLTTGIINDGLAYCKQHWIHRLLRLGIIKLE